MVVYSIVVTYNGFKWIDKCFSSLINSTILEHHILAVDNCSTDNSIEYIRENYPTVEIIQSKRNLGFGQANNLGIKKAIAGHADYIFLLNQDAWISDCTIEDLIKIHLGSNERYGILAPLRIYVNGEIEDIILHSIFNCNISFFSDLYYGTVKNVYGAADISAACWLLTKDCITDVGGFSSVFFHYGEDNDYCRRVLLAGYKIGFCPNVSVIHDRGDRPVCKRIKLQKLYAYTLMYIKYEKRSLIKLLQWCRLIVLLILYSKIILGGSRISFLRRLKKNKY